MYELLVTKLKYSNIVDLDKFSKLNTIGKQEYLIYNNIFIKGHKSELLNEVESDIFYGFTSGFIYKGFYYSINKKISNELYDLLHFYIERENIYIDWAVIVMDIKFKEGSFITKQDKLGFLHSKYNQFNEIFISHSESMIYLEEENPWGYSNWKEFILDTFEDRLFTYLTIGHNRFKSDKIIDTWCEIAESHQVKEYCRKRISEISDHKYPELKKSNITKQVNNKNIKYYSKIFTNEKGEEVLLETLKYLNAIDENNEPIKRKFQPPCEAFFRVANTEKYSIFKGNVFLMDYIQSLNDKFNTKIGRKLSNGEKHESKVIEFLKPYLLN